MSARLLIIALDGADGALLDRWSSDGTLPNLAALRARGGVAKLSAPVGISDDALWASFQYSAGPGDHGRFHWQQQLDTGQMGMAYLNETGRETFWCALSNRGLRVAALDVPKCGLPQPMNGIQLVDWLVHGRYFSEPKSYPATLAAEIIERFGPAPPSQCDYTGPLPSNAELREITANLRTSVTRKRAAGLHYLKSEAWDLFVIAFKEAHCAGHHLWDLADARHAAYDSARVKSLGDPYRTILMDLDAAVGDLVAAAGRDVAIAAFSTTDMEPNATLEHLMPEIVSRINERLGYTQPRRPLHQIVSRLFSRATPPPPCQLLPYNENCTALRVNSQQHRLGRSPGKGRTRAEILEQVESYLRELVDADTGQSVVATVGRPSANHDGLRAASLPDLLVVYRAGAFPRAVVSPGLGRIEAERPSIRPGNHASGGFLVFAGESFAEVKSMQDFGPATAKLLKVVTV